MHKGIKVIIPALNEQNAIAEVIAEIPAGLVREVIVVDNGSKDDTSKVAKAAGATVLLEKRPGYGWACLRGMEYVAAQHSDLPEIVVFIDGDHSDFPSEMPNLLDPIYKDQADMVIGSRALGLREKGAMTPQQLFGNWLATRMIKLFYGVKYTDLGPFRAIRYTSLVKLGMKDKTYGWTVEMQLKAAKLGLRICEVPVNYRKRIGVSKVSGTVKGTILAGYKIIWTIFKYL